MATSKKKDLDIDPKALVFKKAMLSHLANNPDDAKHLGLPDGFKDLPADKKEEALNNSPFAQAFTGVAQPQSGMAKANEVIGDRIVKNIQDAQIKKDAEGGHYDMGGHLLASHLDESGQRVFEDKRADGKTWQDDFHAKDDPKALAAAAKSDALAASNKVARGQEITASVRAEKIAQGINPYTNELVGNSGDMTDPRKGPNYTQPLATPQPQSLADRAAWLSKQPGVTGPVSLVEGQRVASAAYGDVTNNMNYTAEGAPDFFPKPTVAAKAPTPGATQAPTDLASAGTPAAADPATVPVTDPVAPTPDSSVAQTPTTPTTPAAPAAPVAARTGKYGAITPDALAAPHGNLSDWFTGIVTHAVDSHSLPGGTSVGKYGSTTPAPNPTADTITQGLVGPVAQPQAAAPSMDYLQHHNSTLSNYLNPPAHPDPFGLKTLPDPVSPISSTQPSTPDKPTI